MDFMGADEFNDCRLVGGTSLSLQLGHRMSDDIDLFACNTKYDQLEFGKIETHFLEHYPHVKGAVGGKVIHGRTYFVGMSEDDRVKVDVYYSSDDFFQPELVVEGVRMATVEEIIGMKLGIVKNGGRRKDFWDLHELLDSYSINQMLECHRQRFPWEDNDQHVLTQLTNFYNADEEDEDPKCLRGKEWAFIKQDLIEIVGRHKPGPGYTR
ncbi:MAG: nucleotidyl transferase AbiEii/AbiGii toxin family protein [Sphingobacteriales bacterium]